MKTDDGAEREDFACVPPWVAFPRLRPEALPATQGAEEQWIDTQWRPFWRALDGAQRARYLDCWQASAEWRAAIRFYFEALDAPFDIAADAAEAAAWRQSRPPRPSWLRRLLARFRS